MMHGPINLIYTVIQGNFLLSIIKLFLSKTLSEHMPVTMKVLFASKIDYLSLGLICSATGIRPELTFLGKPVRAVAGRNRHGVKKGFRTYCEIGRLGFESVD
jgi:hypothetical protein